MQQLPTPHVEIQSFLTERSCGQHVRPKRGIKGSPHFVSPKAVFTPRRVLDSCICKRHCGMTAELEWIVSQSRLIHSMPSLVQTERLHQIAREVCNGIRVQPAGYPEMLVENRFQVSRNYGLGNCVRIALLSARECRLEK